MGWLFQHGATRADIINRCTAFEENQHGRWKTLAHCTRGNVLWSVVEWHRKESGETKIFIACFLLASQKDSGWGYKDLDESMGPCYYSCPPAYLDMAPETNAEWRQAVREWHARMNRKPEVDEIWSLVGCTVQSVQIVSMRPLRGRCREHGMLYRIPRRLLGERLSASEQVAASRVPVTQAA